MILLWDLSLSLPLCFSISLWLFLDSKCVFHSCRGIWPKPKPFKCIVYHCSLIPVVLFLSRLFWPVKQFIALLCIKIAKRTRDGITKTSIPHFLVFYSFLSMALSAISSRSILAFDASVQRIQRPEWAFHFL